ncbi:PEPxxWA-CTERM sorting domain-containing protein [Phenylobacterium sp. Root700]|uniref:PEPxxWA-CTERM sorting domain-containing protein n=1 Tax=Phenylobacterium sp. Root700 TaxID=1736591 RepID=UPI0006FA1CC5|nr:PEPxxWA-CTERM sorting domain-containing protein [Phenylobacterium sp. Root700]KRB42667.1 hypothetical protein ASE02_21045 [Phenylobacterium sp. Root700]
MNIKLAALAALALGAAGVSAPASAAINAPIPSANYISFGANDWAWASPCPPSGGANGTTCGTGPVLDLGYQSTQGWRLPTGAELAAGPSVADFGTASSFACASAWFTTYSHCDYGDAQGGAIFGAAGGGNWYAETWVVRSTDWGAVPEPATWAMMIVGFGLVGGAVRRRRTSAAFAV